jgi:hypothetical protein
MPGRTGPGSRALHRVTLGSGPLKRGSDRVELLSRLLCVIVVLLALPVALTVGTVVGADAAQQAREQAATRQPVDSLLLGAVPGDKGAETGTLRVPAPATWRAPDGHRETGVVLAPRGSSTGDRVQIWVDASGKQTERPLDAAGVVINGLLAGILTFLGLAALAGVGHVGVCRALWVHRAQQWTHEWRAVEPQWTGRRH